MRRACFSSVIMKAVGIPGAKPARCPYFRDVTMPCNKRQPGVRLSGDRAGGGDWKHGDPGVLAVLRGDASVGHGGRADLPIIPAKLLRPE